MGRTDSSSDVSSDVTCLFNKSQLFLDSRQ
jgi:hypothetical protein